MKEIFQSFGFEADELGYYYIPTPGCISDKTKFNRLRHQSSARSWIKNWVKNTQN
jgi:hypothetical protein